MIRALTLSGFLSAVALVGALFPALDPPEFNLISIDDSTTYFLYNFSLTNPGGSGEGIAAFTLDVRATSGTPDALTASGGTFLDYTDLDGSVGAEAARAPVGPIVPSPWRAVLRRSAELRWFAPTMGVRHTDSIAPGSTLSGLGVRSSYLPGIVDLTVTPTWQSCCEAFDTITGQHPSPDALSETVHAVGPRYMPDEIDIDLLQDQLDTVCDAPLWIDDASLCTEMADSLGAAEDRLAIANIEGARAALMGFGGLIQLNVDPLGDIDIPAAYLLGINVIQLLENIGLPPAYPQSQLCVWAESTATAYFTVLATGDSLAVASPYAVDGEVDGVDPPNGSCAEVWQMPLSGIDTVDVTIRLDSVSAGSELDQIHSSGGLQYGDTVSVWTGQDSLFLSHDGSEASLVIVVLKDTGSQQ